MKTIMPKTIAVCGLSLSGILLGSLLLAGCQCLEPKPCAQEEPETLFSSDTRPEWSYDQPFYIRPVIGVEPIDDFDQPPETIYTSDRLLQIPRPQVGDPRRAPRTAIWMTDDFGAGWTRIGYFGLHQSYYPYRLDKDGVYGIRFIGPGIPPARCKPPKPHLVFHVDTEPPQVAVYVSPDCAIYYPEQMITVEWTAVDPIIEYDSVQVAICLDYDKLEPRWIEIARDCPVAGQIEFVIPDEAIDKTMKIRVSAVDKANNLGIGYSYPIQVSFDPCVETQPQRAGPAIQPVDIFESTEDDLLLVPLTMAFPDL